MTMQGSIEALIAKDAIREVLYLYCHGSDRMDQALVESLFHPDAVLDYGSFQGGPQDLTAFSKEFLPRYEGTYHSLSNIMIRLDGTSATVVSYITAIHSRSKSSKGAKDVILYARYIDRFEQREGEWKIARRDVAMDWTLKLPSDFAWPEGFDGYVGRRDADDPAALALAAASVRS